MQGPHSDWKNWEVGIFQSGNFEQTRKVIEFMDKCYLLLFRDIEMNRVLFAKMDKVFS